MDINKDENMGFDKLTSRVPGVIFQFRISKDGKASIPFANQQMVDVFGISPQLVEEDAHPIFELVHPDDLPDLYRSIEDSHRQLTDWQYEFRIIRGKDGVRWLRGLSRPEMQPDQSCIWHGYILDVTDRKLKEQENQDARLKFQGYFESAKDGLFVVNRAGYYLEANPAACDMTGYTLEELRSMHVKDLVDPSFNENEKKTLERSFSEGWVDEEVLLKKKNGDSFWVRLVTSRIHDDSVIAFCHDVTERKHQERLLKNQFDFQKLVAEVSTGFVNATSESFNDAVMSTLKYCGEFFKADRAYVFIYFEKERFLSNTHEWCAENITPQINNLQKLETDQVPWWWEQLTNKKTINIGDVGSNQQISKTEKDILEEQEVKAIMSIPMINKGILIGFLGLDRTMEAKDWDAQQVTQFNLIADILSGAFARSFAEEALRQSENRYRLLAENARDVIYRLSLKPVKRFEYMSPSSVNLTGYRPEEYYNDPMLDEETLHPEDRKVFTQNYYNALKESKPLVVRIISKTGEIVWCEQNNVPIYDDKGELVALEGIARNITQQKEFEQKLQELNSELLEKKEALELLNQSLQESINQEVEKNRELDHLMALQARQAAIGEMIANIAHQWRQPLNVLSLAILDLADAFEYGELDKKYIENTVEEMNRVIQDMSKTIDDFRNYFKPERSKTQFAIADVVNAALNFLSPYFQKENIRVNKDVPREMYIYGYPSQLEQVVINILKNAIDAQKEIPPEEKEVMVKCRKDDNSGCFIEISNNGNPIPEDFFPRLYDPYFSTKPEGQGLGLGLYIAKTIVEKNMDGKLFCENTHSGVKFSVELNCQKTINPDY